MTVTSRTYRAVWEAHREESDAHELLATVARLRIWFTSEDLLGWFEPPVVRAFRENLAYLFRSTGDAWAVFHDSFRQYAGRSQQSQRAAQH